jgi:hypothetical protein
MAIVAITLFAIQTFDVALGILHNFHAFVESSDPEKTFLNISDWINIARVCHHSMITLSLTQKKNRP